MSAADPVFLDTNILVYWADELAGEKHQIAQQIIRDPELEFFVSPQVISEFCNVMTRKAKVPMFAMIAVMDMLAPWCRVVVDADFVREAALISVRHSFSLYDAQIILAALRSGCTKLYSEDMQHGFKYKGVEIVNPFLGLDEVSS